MKYQIIYHTDAENDIRSNKKWYKEQQIGLEKSFVLALKKTISYIIENPLLFEVKYRNTRVAFTEKFPFGVHYQFDNISKITIFTILHTSKNPFV
ncbi:type II toxin-antitoxin system RelE/ParE family toxin [Flavobacterium sp. TAB 87]|uniref:type II toxin-antitoxin system RelE/ParE family toxin n=1 Tax=Flavobacterium sp. TAB 87 TaxID=1729581 RepID=UPI00076BEF05|nr:type II toxin-antitoxin system RelE/ParE family toxin [Flavobacterium sp. TAB 87]KVV14108.1 Plasmid stabilization system protein [Flavobacterium sp. TAB 87]